jgi:predicted N-acyltransferase
MGDIEQGAVTVRLMGAIAEVEAAAWDACAGADNPFVSHAFLSALEASGSAAPESGWAPYHLVVEDGRGGLSGALPVYLKSHSFGEFVFDHAWAHAYERAGGRYYPKLQVSVPFSPVPGPRLLVRPGPEAAQTRAALVAGAIEVARRLEVSSLHVTFCQEDEWRLLGDAGFLLRTDQQFHWENQGYASFDEFLSSLASRKRKAIRRERREALESGVTIEALSGEAIGERHWDAFFRFYLDTGDRKWGSPYLNRDFFRRLGQTMAERVMLVMCARDGHYIAGALNLVGGEALYGRYWGAIEQHPFLHFEACYYRAIDYAIEHRLSRVEAGAQGQHKLARGYLPSRTYSAHWVRDRGFHEALETYLQQERFEVDLDIRLLGDRSPFRQEGGSQS